MPQLEHEDDSANFKEGPLDFNKTLQLNGKWRIEITVLVYNKDKKYTETAYMTRVIILFYCTLKDI